MPDLMRRPQYGSEGMTLLGRQVADGVSSALAVQNIPPDFRELYITWQARSTLIGAQTVYLAPEGGATPNYYCYEYLYSANTTNAAALAWATTGFQVGVAPSRDAAALLVASGEVWIPDYARAGDYHNVLIHTSYIQNVASDNLIVWEVAGWFNKGVAIPTIWLYVTAGAFGPLSELTVWGLD